MNKIEKAGTFFEITEHFQIYETKFRNENIFSNSSNIFWVREQIVKNMISFQISEHIYWKFQIEKKTKKRQIQTFFKREHFLEREHFLNPTTFCLKYEHSLNLWTILENAAIFLKNEGFLKVGTIF